MSDRREYVFTGPLPLRELRPRMRVQFRATGKRGTVIERRGPQSMAVRIDGREMPVEIHGAVKVDVLCTVRGLA